MDIAQAGEVATQFIRQYVKSKNFWTPQEVIDAAAEDPDDDESTLILCPGSIAPDPRDPEALWIVFLCGVVIDVDTLVTVNRPEQRQRVEETLAALRQAHPELAGTRARVSMEDVRGASGPTWTLTF